MKFEAGKSYRLIDQEGFKGQSPLTDVYYNVRDELKTQKVVTCLRVNDNGAVFNNSLYIKNNERKYFEEI